MSNLSKIGSERDWGVFGEVEGPISGHSRVKTSKDWYHCICMVTNQYPDALLEVCFTAWSLTTSITARGGQWQRIWGGLRGLNGFKSCLLGKI